MGARVCHSYIKTARPCTPDKYALLDVVDSRGKVAGLGKHITCSHLEKDEGVENQRVGSDVPLDLLFLPLKLSVVYQTVKVLQAVAHHRI